MADVPKPKFSSGMKRAPARRRPRKAKAGSRGLTPIECRLDALSGEGAEARNRVEAEGGIVLGCYSDPLGKNPLILAILAIDSIEPTPFQRDLSQAHHRRLADVIDRTGLFLDPVIDAERPAARLRKEDGCQRQQSSAL